MELTPKQLMTINALTLDELAHLLEVSDEELDKHILDTRNEFNKYADMKISEAFPKIVSECNMNDIMRGAILATFVLQYFFEDYVHEVKIDNH